jgi:hypothetical protein
MLNHFVTVTVPSTGGGSFRDRISEVSDAMIRECGGCTVVRGRGSYAGADGFLFVEDVALVTGYTEYEFALYRFHAYARAWCDIWNQECVAVTSEDGMCLIEREV